MKFTGLITAGRSRVFNLCALFMMAFLVSLPAYAAIAPTYNKALDQVDATMTHIGGGIYTVPLSAEIYGRE